MSLNKITVVDKHQDDISETEAGDKFVSWGFIPVPVNTHTGCESEGSASHCWATFFSVTPGLCGLNSDSFNSNNNNSSATSRHSLHKLTNEASLPLWSCYVITRND